MWRDSVRRLVVVCLLSAVLFGMLTHYGAVAAGEGRDSAEASHRKLEAYDEHVGERLYFWGTVVDAGDEALVVRAGGRRLTVVGTDANTVPGDVVQVYGTAREGGEVTADRVIVSRRTNLRYLYAVSAVGLVVAVAAFFQDWTVQPRTLLVRPREEGDD